MQTIPLVVTDRQFAALNLAAGSRNVTSPTNPGYPYSNVDVLMEKVSQVEKNWGAKVDAGDPVASEAGPITTALANAMTAITAAQQLAAAAALTGTANSTAAGHISTYLKNLQTNVDAKLATLTPGSSIIPPS